MLHWQNKLNSAQGLSKKCIIYVRVLRKHFKSKRQQLYLWVMNIDVSKITHCTCMSLCSLPIALFFWTPNFFQTYTRLNLNSSIGGKEASKKPITVQMQSFDSHFRSSGLGVRPRMDSLRRIEIFKRNNPKQFVIPSHSAAHSNIITAIFAIKSRARHCS